MQTTNPFPGMNPFLQSRWSDARTRLIAYVGDAIGAELPGDLTVVAEEALVIDSPDPESDRGSRFRADVAMTADETLRMPEHLKEPPIGDTAAVAEPLMVRVSRTHRWLEIRDTRDRVITVIELLSPSNKDPDASYRFAKRQDALLASGVNTVDIDLIRGGRRALPDEFIPTLKQSDSTTFLMVVGRGHDVDARAFHYCPLKERLPAISVPLRQTDHDVVLDVQPLVDRCYEMGRYWQLSQKVELDPPLTNDEQAWAEQLLIDAGLKG